MPGVKNGPAQGDTCFTYAYIADGKIKTSEITWPRLLIFDMSYHSEDFRSLFEIRSMGTKCHCGGGGAGRRSHVLHMLT